MHAQANLNIQTTMGSSALYIAAQVGNDNVVLAMLEEDSGATSLDVNLPKKGGVTPLMIAAKKGHLRVVTLLLKTSKFKFKCHSNGVSVFF